MFENIQHHKHQRSTWSLDTGNNVYYEGLFTDEWLMYVVSVTYYQRYHIATYNCNTVFYFNYSSKIKRSHTHHDFAIDLPTKKEIVTFKLANDMAKIREKWPIDDSITTHVRILFEVQSIHGEISKQELLELEAILNV